MALRKAEDRLRLVTFREKAYVEGEAPIALPIELDDVTGPPDDVAHVSLQGERMQALDLRRRRRDVVALGQRALHRGLEARRACGSARGLDRQSDRLDRQIEAENAAGAHPAFHLDIASHQPHVPAGDRQTEAGAAAALPFGNLLEGLEDGLELIGGNADAGVFDLEP